jgi:hypothetical protein
MIEIPHPDLDRGQLLFDPTRHFNKPSPCLQQTATSASVALTL